MPDDLFGLLLAAGAGLLAGAINTVAGGGSLLTLPLLIFLGLPPNVANGTNRVGILLQSIVATASFRREGAFELRLALKLALPTVLGSILGALLSADLDPALFKRIIAAALLLMLGLMLAKNLKKKPPAPDPDAPPLPPPPPRPYPLQALAFFGVGFYGGFLQAGVGFFLLAALNLVSDLDLVRANALKVALTLALTLVALPVFILHDQIHWPLGLALSAGAMLGAWLGTKMTVSWGPRFVQVVLIVVVVASVAKLAWEG